MPTINPFKGLNVGALDSTLAGAGAMPLASNTRGGFFQGLQNLLANKAFQQLLMSAGVDLMTGAGGMNTKKTLDQQIGSENITKLLSEMLSGKMPGAEVKIGEGGMQIKVPGINTTPSAPGQAPITGMPSLPQPSTTPTTGLNIPQQLMGTLNPFVLDLSNLKASDLAGLSPELILQTLGAKMGQEELNQKKFSDVMNAIYQQGQLGIQQQQNVIDAMNAVTRQGELGETEFSNRTARLNALRQLMPDEILNPFPIKTPNGITISNSQFASLPTDDRSYMLYYDAAIKAGQVPMDRAKWAAVQPTEQIKTLTQLKADPEALALELKLRKASSTSVNLGPYVNKLETERGARQAEVQAPDFFNIVQKNLEDNGGFDTIPFEIVGTPQETFERKKIVINEMDRRIREAYKNEGIVEVKPDGWYINGKLIQGNPYYAR